MLISQVSFHLLELFPRDFSPSIALFENFQGMVVILGM